MPYICIFWVSVKILALLTIVDSLAGSAGIKYLGHIRVTQESYQPAFNLLILLCLVSASLVVVLIKLKKPENAKAS